MVEDLTGSWSRSIRRWLGIGRRVPDTTLRDLLCQLSPRALRPHLHALIRAAFRRKALTHDGLPFGVVSRDGNGTACRVATTLAHSGRPRRKDRSWA